MPSPKAVLRDITDVGLDPKKAHRRCVASGRLARAPEAPKAPEVHVMKLALKQIVPEAQKETCEAVEVAADTQVVVVAPVVNEPALVEVVADTPVAVAAPAIVADVTKKRAGRKADKAEKQSSD